MGFRARKSISISKGVRLNISKTGVGMSVGARGARYSVHSSGRRTSSVGIPGSGLGWTSTSTGRSRSAPARTTRTQVPAVAAPKPGVFTPRGEKELHRALMAGDVAGIERVAGTYPDYQIPAQFLIGMDALGKDNAKAAAWLRGVLDWQGNLSAHPFVKKYLSHVPIGVDIAPGVTAGLPIGRNVAALLLAEALQGQGEAAAAIEVVEALEPTSYAAVSLADLYAELERWADVIDLTNGITNEDDATALLCALRGRAFRHEGHFDAAREALKEALRSRKRPNEIIHLALTERAETYAAQNRKAQARKDLERILADDSNYPGVRERLAELQ